MKVMKGFAVVLVLAVVGLAAAVEKEAAKAVGDEVASADRETRSPSFLTSSNQRQSTHDYDAKKQQGQAQSGFRSPNQQNAQGLVGQHQNQNQQLFNNQQQNNQHQGVNQQGFQPNQQQGSNQQGSQFFGLSGFGNNQGFQGQFVGPAGFGFRNNQGSQGQFAGQSGFGNNQNQQGQLGGQFGFGNNQNQQSQLGGQGGFGNNQNQQGQSFGPSGFRNNQNQQGSGFGTNHNQQGQFNRPSGFGNNQNQQGQFNRPSGFFNNQNQLGQFNRFLQPNQFINQNQQPIVGLFSNSPSARSCVNSNEPNCNQASQATHIGIFYPISRQPASG